MVELSSVIAAKMSGMYEEVETQRRGEEGEEGRGPDPAKEDPEPDKPPLMKEAEEARAMGPKRPQRVPDIPQLERRNWLIHQHVVRRETETAKELIRETVEETGAGAEYPLLLQGLLLRREGRIEESLAALQQCAVLNPSKALYASQIARSLFLLGRAAEAVAVFEEAERLDPFDADLHQWKARALRQQGLTRQAKETLKTAVKLKPSEAGLSLLAELLEEEGDTVAAIEAYKAALEANPESVDVLSKLGQLYLARGSEAQAFEALGRCLSLKPDHPAAILAAGSMMQRHGDFDVALSKYRLAAQAIPDSAQLWTNVAMCFYAKKKFVAAISCLKRANYLAPFDWKVLYNLGVVHLGMEQHASAFHFLSAAVNLNPALPLLYMSLAVALTRLDDPTNARLAYQKAMALDSRDPTIPLNQAIFLHNAGDKDAALQAFTLYEARLPSVRDPQSGVLNLDSEVLDMADRFRQIAFTSGSSQPAPGPIPSLAPQPIQPPTPAPEPPTSPDINENTPPATAE